MLLILLVFPLAVNLSAIVWALISRLKRIRTDLSHTTRTEKYLFLVTGSLTTCYCLNCISEIDSQVPRRIRHTSSPSRCSILLLSLIPAGFFLRTELISTMDRRTPMPDNMVETGLTQEPGFGLNVHYDYTRPGDTKYAYVEPVAYAGASTITQYRYVVEDPTGTLYILLLNGDFQQYSGTNGWQGGSPQPVSFPLTKTGTYLITLEQ